MNSHRTLTAAMAVVIAAALPAVSQTRPIGDSEVFAAVPAPGFPEGVAVRGNTVYVSGPAAFGLTAAPKVWAYDLNSRQLVKEYAVQISNPYAGMRGLSCIAFGADGKLYAVEPFVGIIRMSLDDANTQEVYSPFPPPPPSGSLLNDLTFDNGGNLYVSDSFQGLIYKIAPGGGAPQVWFQDPRLLGNPALPFGANGIRFDKTKNALYIAVTVRNDFSGAIYKLPAVSAPAAADLEEFHVYAPTQFGPQAPDGMAFGKSGNLYVALAGSSQISVLAPDGTEVARYSGPARVPGTSNTLPWANPANLAFTHDGETLLATNHASLVPYDPALFAVFDLVVGDKGQPLP